jgi:hypothetical protein
VKAGQQGLHSPELFRQQPEQAELVGQPIKPQHLQQPRGPQRPPHAPRIGEQAIKDPPLEPTGGAFALLPRGTLLHFDPERLDQPAVLHARGTGGLAAPAVE